jgi:hypothetical protein
MNDDRAFERATQEFLDEGSDRASASTIDAVLLAVRTTPQERDLRIPWRTAQMSNPMRLIAALMVIVVASVAAINLFGGSSGVGSLPSPSPTPGIVASPSASALTAAPTPSAQPTPYSIDTTTWLTYTSARYGFSIGHPADWAVHTTATRDWTFPADATVNMYSTALETFVSPGSTIAAAAWSVAVQPGTTLDTWLQAYCPLAESPAPSDCATLPGRTVAASMDGHAGSLVRFTQDTQAFFLVGNRIYVVAIWQSENFIPGGVSRLLEAYLSTMHLLPGGPAPSAPIPSPS